MKLNSQRSFELLMPKYSKYILLGSHDFSSLSSDFCHESVRHANLPRSRHPVSMMLYEDPQKKF